MNTTFLTPNERAVLRLTAPLVALSTVPLIAANAEHVISSLAVLAGCAFMALIAYSVPRATNVALWRGTQNVGKMQSNTAPSAADVVTVDTGCKCSQNGNKEGQPSPVEVTPDASVDSGTGGHSTLYIAAADYESRGKMFRECQRELGRCMGKHEMGWTFVGKGGKRTQVVIVG